MALDRILTDRMLEFAGALLRETKDAFPLLSVSVNLTLPEVSAAHDAERLTSAVQAAGVAPNRIVFEITEAAMATDWALAVENLARLRMRGFGLSIDDFGTGYSSLQQLLRLPFSELKLDRSFISGIGPGSAKYALVEGTIRMAKKLTLSTVAEGIELPTEAQTLLELGCDMGQGYAFSRTLDQAHFVRWLGSTRAAGLRSCSFG
jgi:EAL domain-containing protein (putative c-di-GMP-specific phosphodiesterase class I)